MNSTYRLYEYKSFNDIIRIVKDSGIIDEQAETNEHIDYLNDYLECIGTKSFIFEPEYVDRDYMEDYTRYYAKCFQRYSKLCSRIIFFGEKFNQSELEKDIIEGNTEIIKSLQSNFLGFIVLRPLPKTILGKICLKTYPVNEYSNRIFPVLRNYKIHFLGIELTIKSLAFQEQDNAIAACATSALWSALQGLGYGWGKNNTSSPSEITQNAKKIISDYSKNFFPNKGLQTSQMAHAIKEEGFEPLLTGFVNISYTKALIRAYMQAHIPIILGVVLVYEEEEGMMADGTPRNKPIGFHAVTVNGYNISKGNPKEFDMGNIPIHIDRTMKKSLYMYSSRMDKIYVHDDRLGPFVKMELRDEYFQRLQTHWNEYTNPDDKINASINTILIPLYPKIRIKFHLIFSIICDFNTYYMEGWKKTGTNIEWDIHLSTVCNLKKEWLEMNNEEFEDNTIKLQMLSVSMPKFIWVANAINTNDGKKNFTFIFDATDVENSDLFICAIHYKQKSYMITHFQATLAKQYNIIRKDNLYNFQSWKILSYHLNNSDKIIKPKTPYTDIGDIDRVLHEYDSAHNRSANQ